MGVGSYLSRLGEAVFLDVALPLQGRRAIAWLPAAMGTGALVGGGIPYLAGADKKDVAIGAAAGAALAGFKHPFEYLGYVNELRTLLAAANLPKFFAEGLPIIESAATAVPAGAALAGTHLIKNIAESFKQRAEAEKLKRIVQERAQEK